MTIARFIASPAVLPWKPLHPPARSLTIRASCCFARSAVPLPCCLTLKACKSDPEERLSGANKVFHFKPSKIGYTVNVEIKCNIHEDSDSAVTDLQPETVSSTEDNAPKKYSARWMWSCTLSLFEQHKWFLAEYLKEKLVANVDTLVVAGIISFVSLYCSSHPYLAKMQFLGPFMPFIAFAITYYLLCRIK